MGGLLIRALSRFITKGNLVVVMPDGSRHELGDGSGGRVVLKVDTTHAMRRMLADASLGFAEGYMDGEVSIEEGDLLDLLHLAFVNGNYEHATGPLAALKSGAAYVLRRLQQINTAGRSRANVHHHYDLSGEMYRLFLDPDMQYSCAYFEHPGQSLDEAQLAKKRHIAAKLRVEPGQSVLDIGSGWGGLGLYLARNLGASVQGVTLSDEQLAVARERAEGEGLDNLVRFDLRDYRSLETRFDRIVSVGMFEHVGLNHFASFFEKAAELLKDEGVMLLHTIGRSGPPAATDAFIRKHIFPGGYIPSMSEVLPVIERAGLVLTDVEILRFHYAQTLKAWRERFNAHHADVVKLLDERFFRMWNLYLAGSEAGFRWGDLVVFQFQLTHAKSALPMTRNYIAEDEEKLRRLEEAEGVRPPPGLVDAA
ncbi:MAG: class I SAM-dependent methyltransferase [Methylobacterium mesophilicum]|nr:class I SAM-dependent methyltransferase [Methylobacterium mesophilicum]